MDVTNVRKRIVQGSSRFFLTTSFLATQEAGPTPRRGSCSEAIQRNRFWTVLDKKLVIYLLQYVGNVSYSEDLPRNSFLYVFSTNGSVAQLTQLEYLPFLKNLGSLHDRIWRKSWWVWRGFAIATRLESRWPCIVFQVRKELGQCFFVFEPYGSNNIEHNFVHLVVEPCWFQHSLGWKHGSVQHFVQGWDMEKVDIEQKAQARGWLLWFDTLFCESFGQFWCMVRSCSLSVWQYGWLSK